MRCAEWIEPALSFPQISPLQQSYVHEVLLVCLRNDHHVGRPRYALRTVVPPQRSRPNLGSARAKGAATIRHRPFGLALCTCGEYSGLGLSIKAYSGGAPCSSVPARRWSRISASPDLVATEVEEAAQCNACAKTGYGGQNSTLRTPYVRPRWMTLCSCLTGCLVEALASSGCRVAYSTVVDASRYMGCLEALVVQLFQRWPNNNNKGGLAVFLAVDVVVLD